MSPNDVWMIYCIVGVNISDGHICRCCYRCKQPKVSGRHRDAPLNVRTFLFLAFAMSLGMSYKPNLNAHLPGTSINQAGSVHSPSTSMATSAQYRQLINDYGPPSLGYTQGMQGTSSSQVPQSKYAELLAIIEELGKEIRPTYAGSKSAMERLKRGIIHARGLVRECLAETERNARS
ncbi:cyclin-dependent kinase 2-associated protein 1 isoform X1 [Trachemys scripta elegans]|uniref:Cyclin dependent kinase 2 associated protein 1 n=2 Tax=Testudinoidea TaxID=8486 RepID=A0A8C3ISY0_CHRPI|nr:cyclin-dependent kinase 2-associated protein 1 isoform X1 [Chrysemys picta bellii]XP_034647385.1 cyclin-dependent kinase 2-associated protein 1 isoform X1 [Trachemys scripta elegans]XP_038228796.1 cyclin-dependent kinase 2-associated protein 1 isoform X1 [Dermochelys coriacea]XP_053862630.1 cyclin-dependent kinase 2-associated protein 1 [Malaclemys terrapin pileata]